MLNEVYKCAICGNIVEVVHASGGTLVCCGQPMNLMKENADDSASKEKHVPIIIGKLGKKVRVGIKKHPMEEKHYIEWVEAEGFHESNSNNVETSGVPSKGDGKQTSKVFLKPGDKPEVKFGFKIIGARAYCNLHGLWKS